MYLCVKNEDLEYSNELYWFRRRKAVSPPLQFMVFSDNIQPRLSMPNLPHCHQILLFLPRNVKQAVLNDILWHCYQGNKIEHFEMP